MQINLITIGKRMPSWIEEGFQTYAKRMPHQCSLKLIEIEMQKRHKNSDISQIIEQEGKQLLAATTVKDYLIALDADGKQFDTTQLADQMQAWLNEGSNISLLIGGPDGLSKECLEKAKMIWSLSKLTFPHPLVRVIVAEQIYRAWSILSHHPYHRN